MTKYSDAFKHQIVQEYLKGTLGYKRLAKKHNMPSGTPIRQWVRAYQEFGPDGFKRKHQRTVYPVQFKVDVLHFMKQSGASYSDTAIAFGLNNPSLIANWSRAFQDKGLEGLKSTQKGRPSMSKKTNQPQDNQPNLPSLSREELLRENELLRLEVAYLKKLEAFQKNPDAFLEKHKQNWHSNSKKKDSN